MQLGDRIDWGWVMHWRPALSGQRVQHVLMSTEKIIAGSIGGPRHVPWLFSDIVIFQTGRGRGAI